MVVRWHKLAEKTAVEPQSSQSRNLLLTMANMTAAGNDDQPDICNVTFYRYTSKLV